MAKQIPYTDFYGESYPESYWRPEQLNFTKKDGYILFYGYPDEERRGKRVIGQKEYVVTPEIFEEYMKAPPEEDASAFAAIASKAYEIADAVLDVKAEGVAVSFFDGASDI